MRFETGAHVRTRAQRESGHTRLPAYLQCKPGVVVCVLGAYPLADERAADPARARLSPLYTVEFQARDIWNDSSAAIVHADLFEEYLEPME
jgi:nitrile hydratase